MIFAKVKKLIFWCICLFYAVFWGGSMANKIQEGAKNVTEQSRWIFTQHDYDVVIHIAEAVFYNRTYFSKLRLALDPYNRTQRVVNGTITVIKDISNDTRVDLQVLKFMSNEYRYFPIAIAANPCHEFAVHSLGFKEDVMKASNFKGCPIKKGSYYIRDWLPDFSKFPPYLPRGQFKMIVKNYHKDDYLLQTDFYWFIKDKPMWV